MKKKLQVRYAISAQAAPETHSMMQSNGRTRFILKLREKAADLEKMAEILQGTYYSRIYYCYQTAEYKCSQEREKSDADSLERKWNAAKAISKSARFARYIEDLQDHGNNDKELQSMVKEATLIQAILCPENVSASESLDMSKATTQEASTSTISPLHKSILELRQEIDASPFKPKEKSLLRKIILDEFLENYVFGNSSHTNEVSLKALLRNQELTYGLKM